ncbi:MAG: hypothetical protein L0922_01770 [Candidatus Mariimomonas ferrooxydans]
MSSNKNATYEKSSFLQYGSVKDDLEFFLGLAPFHIIFSDREQVNKLFKLMGTVDLVLPLLESLDYFKEKDFYTYRHILVVFVLTTLLAEEMISAYQARIMEISTAPTHDIGKICVPLHILKKSDPLTRSELMALTHHSAAGYVLLSYYLRDSRNLSTAVAINHHERRDGSGYPRGVQLRDQLVEIVAVSDVYDALISMRPYRPIAYDNRTAIEEITGMAERKEVGWEAVRAIVAHSRRDKPHYNECKVSSEKRGTPPPGNVHGRIAKEDDNQDTEKEENKESG